MKMPELFRSQTKSCKLLGIRDYRVPKTNLYLIKEFTIPNEGRFGPFEAGRSKEASPDPTKYSPSISESVKKYWLNNSGKISLKERKTFVDI